MNRAPGNMTQYIRNPSTGHVDNMDTGNISSRLAPLPPALLWFSLLGEGLEGSVHVSSDRFDSEGAVDEPVKRVSRVSKEYSLLRYRNSIMAYWIAVLVCSAHRIQRIAKSNDHSHNCKQG